MFKRLELRYFRKVEHDVMTFGSGLIVIRGANESSKTTRLEAMGYALFGATSLREPLEDTVTWGRKVGDLKVALDFHLNGVDYSVARSKSGAEIKSGAKILAHGQKEVTRYVEALLGASAEVCSKLMLASQDDIKGALSKGPSAAIELIEALSDLSVIDKIITMVQEKLPSGSTVAVSARIAGLNDQVSVPVVDETGPLRIDLDECEMQLSVDDQEHRKAKDAYDAAQPDAIKAQAAVDANRAAQAALTQAQNRLNNAQTALDGFTVPDAPSVDEVALLRRKADDAGYMSRALAAATALEKLDEWPDEAVYQGTLEELQAARAKVQKVFNDARSAEFTLLAKIAELRSQKITQTVCGLCSKDLSAVPEVVTKNAELDQRIAEVQENLDLTVEVIADAKQELESAEALMQADAAHRRIQAKAAEFCKLVETTVPCSVEWTGPEELTETTGNEAALLAQAEAKVTARAQALGQRIQLQNTVETAAETLTAATATARQTEQGLDKHEEYLNTTADLLSDMEGKARTLETQRRATEQAHQALNIAQAVHRERVNAREALMKQLSDAQKELAEMEDNNALVKYLREARPIITDQLWSIVTTTVSSYFSDIRGTQSVVTREDNGFKVDGHNVAGLSGSTKDALGLAIRKALTKTFLPNASFMMLDEPAAAADAERETNMLGLIASGGFEQVILITHSDLADSFATQVVQL